MSLVGITNFRSSLSYAIAGLRYVYRHERNFRIHITIAVLALLLAAILQVSALQWLFITSAIVSVLALEIMNTIFEKLVDLFQPRAHHYAAVVKDLMAAAVLVASVSAVIVGGVIFIPRIISRLA